MLGEFIEQLRNRQDLDEAAAEQALERVLQPETPDEEIRAFLIALADKGETPEEIAGFARGMRRMAVRVRSRHEYFVDTAGTGGGRPTFNISTTAAFVIAGAGVPVAKHGNRAATSRCGSADVLEALGIPTRRPAEVSQQALDEIGICFLFAPTHHPSMQRVAQIRRELGRRTIFNLLGPLTNPAGAPCQLIGVFAPELTEKLGKVLQRLGTRRSWVVHSRDGFDELSTAAGNRVAEVGNGDFQLFEFQRMPVSDVPPVGGTPEENAALLAGILAGEIQGGALGVVLLNAAAAVHLATGMTFSEAYREAEASVNDGKAERKLNQLREFYLDTEGIS
ncbi:MAG TPA: anthranilate phosphoribosyltransferase [Acidobacteriota bacterium]|nr:anthranilate phosphoribosyltransferase [Acidobacteriota bacterium]